MQIVVLISLMVSATAMSILPGYGTAGLGGLGGYPLGASWNPGYLGGGYPGISGIGGLGGLGGAYGNLGYGSQFGNQFGLSGLGGYNPYNIIGGGSFSTMGMPFGTGPLAVSGLGGFGGYNPLMSSGIIGRPYGK